MENPDFRGRAGTIDSAGRLPNDQGAPGRTCLNGDGPDWGPPRNRQDIDEAILSLSNDIGLILAQLAEDQLDWCRRTGRSPLEHVAWRRRALFAKVHKERQLRECKRARARLTEYLLDRAVDAGPVDNGTDLILLCRRVISAWGGLPAGSAATVLDECLEALAECLGVEPPQGNGIDLRGRKGSA